MHKTQINIMSANKIILLSLFALCFLQIFTLATSSSSLFKHVQDLAQSNGGRFTFSKDSLNKAIQYGKQTYKDIQDGKQTYKGLLSEVQNLIPNGEGEDALSDLKLPSGVHTRRRRAVNQRKPPELTSYELNDPNNHLIVHWAGFNSSVLVVLTKSMMNNGIVTSSNVYFSYNYGKTYKRKIFDPSSPGSSTPSAFISNFYTCRTDINRYIFTDVHTNSIYITTDAGNNIVPITGLQFTPNSLSIHPVNPYIVLGHDTTSSDKGLYKSNDFGRTWVRIQTKVKSAEWGYSAGKIQYEKENALYVQREEIDGSLTILRTETYFQDDTSDQVLISNVEDFIVMNASMFATRNTLSGPEKELWLSTDRHSRFVRANFPTSLTKLEFYVVDASDSQIMVCVNHAPGITHLYVSEPNQIDFTLSLENITYYNPKGPVTSLSLYASERFADIHKVNGMRSIYIANTMSAKASSLFDSSSMKSVITFNKGGMWERIPVPAVDAGGDKINCSMRSGCSLHLTQYFHQAYPSSLTSPIFSQPSAPGFILAQGNVGKNIKHEPDLFFSFNAGANWTQVLSGTWLYTWGDHGGIIVAFPKFERSDTLWYSTNEGELWNTYKFSNESIRVYGLMTEPGEMTSTFTLFGSTNKAGHSWLIVQVDLKNIFNDVTCKEDDYKSWSPTDEHGITCLLGSQTTYKRRRQHANCFNGRNYDRPTKISVCQCTRSDFECDAGYTTSLYFGFSCVPESNSTVNIYQVPATCYSGGYYNRSKGYRKLEGDICSRGPAESHYSPDRVPCPIVKENSFMMLSTSDGLYRIDMENNETIHVGGDIRQAITMDFDYQNNTVYWSNGTFLLCTNLTTSVTTTIVSNNVSIWKVAYDWLTGNIYWVDLNLHVSNSRGVSRELPVGNCSGHIASVALSPTHGLLYYMCVRLYGQTLQAQGLYQANMDGSNMTRIRQTFGYSHHIDNNDVSYDATTDRLYWVENNHVKTTYRDGSGFSYLYYQSSSYRTGFISVFKNNLYWLQSSTYSNPSYHVAYGDKFSPVASNYLNINTNWNTITAMKIFMRQSSGTPNPCSNKKCTQLCVPMPSASSGIEGKCLCGNDGSMTIEINADGNEHCVCPQGQSYNQTQGYCEATNKTCLYNEFLCSNLRCVLSLWRCDNEDDCGDGSDERDCATHACGSYQFQCANNNRCIPNIWKCDRDNDCGDGSDEQDCTYAPCPTSMFHCHNGRCKNPHWTCDGDNDCGDWSDERNCNTTTTPQPPSECNPTYQFHCSQPTGAWVGNCLPRTWLCDGDFDCADHSDEANCSGHTACDQYKSACANGQCIYNWWFCDGDTDCTDMSDEAPKNPNCSNTTPAYTPTTPTIITGNHTCTGTDLKCRETGTCYPLAWRCDGVDDCGDDSDEFDCPTNSSNWNTQIPEIPCFSAFLQFTCGNGRCVFTFYKCDGDNDCGDWSDERNCPNRHGNSPGCVEGRGTNYQGTRSYTKTGRTCQRWDSNTPHTPRYRPQNPNHNYCRNPDHDISGLWCYTTDPNKRWDYCGVPHCSTHSASVAPPTAGPHPCADGFLYCGEGGTRRCIFERYACDGDDDCGNGADERNCGLCPGQFQCANKRCIASSLQCDRNDDCLDNSDENNCTTYACEANSFRCGNRQCIPTRRRCNNYTDCPDGSDELGCATFYTTPSTGVTCSDGSIISYDALCNYKLDCSDGSDERVCQYMPSPISSVCDSPTDQQHTCMNIHVRPLSPYPHSKLGSFMYLVYYMPGRILNETIANVQQGGTSNIQLSGLQFNKVYSYGVALNFNGYSLPIQRTSQFTTPQGRPGAPRFVGVVPLSGNGVSITWKPPAKTNGVITGYRVQMYLHRYTAATYRVVGGDVQTTELWQLTPGSWKVRVQARTSVGYGNYTPPGNATIGHITVRPPTGISFKNVKRTSATLTWVNSQQNIKNFNVEVMNSNEVMLQRHTVAGNITALTLSNLEPGQTFDVRIAAMDSTNHTSAYTNWVTSHTSLPSTSVPLILTNQSQAVDVASVRLYWTSVEDELTKSGITYEVEYGESETELESAKAVRNANNTIINQLRHNRQTLFKVRVSSPFVGRWSDFVPLSPKKDFSKAPLDLTVVTSSPWTYGIVKWTSRINTYGQLVSYKLTVTNTDTRKTNVYLDSHSASLPFVHNVTNLQPYNVYNATVIDTTDSNDIGAPSTFIFFTGHKIPPPFALSVVKVDGTKDFVFSFDLSKRYSAYYSSVLRGVQIVLCEGSDVSAPNKTGCRNVHELDNSTREILLTNLKLKTWYTVFAILQCTHRIECSSSYESQTFNSAQSQPTSSAILSLSKTNVIAIATSTIVIVAALIGGIVFLVRRHRKLQQSYHSFLSSHYDPRSGEAVFVNDEDEFGNGLDDDINDETPMISGFADDEPLIVA